MPPYEGPERRKDFPCALHNFNFDQVNQNFERGEKRMDRFEAKIDILIERQAEQAVSIQSLQDKIGNGLRSDIRRTVEAVAEMRLLLEKACGQYDLKLQEHEAKIEELNKFEWFRTWANKFRATVMAKILTFVSGLGAIIGLVSLFVFIAEKFLKYATH